MKITKTERAGRYLVENAGIPGRSVREHSDWGWDDWHYSEHGEIFGTNADGWVSAVFPTADGEGTEEVELDLSQCGVGMEGTLFERVAFMRRYTADVIKSREEAA